MADEIKIIYEPPEEDVTVVEEAPVPFELEASPLDRMLGREKTSPEVGSLRDTIERKRRGMPTASEVNTRTADAQIMNALGKVGRYDTSSTFEDVNGMLSLFDVSRSNENTEQYRKFKAKYPKGDLVFVPTDEGTVPVARISEEDPFRRLGNIGPIAATIASPQTAVGIAAGIMTGGMSLPLSMAAQGLAGAGASAIDNLIEYMRGYQDTGLGGMAGEAALEGAMNAAIEPVARGLTGAIGKGKEAVVTSFKELAEASGEIPVLRGQYGNPAKTAIFKFVSRLSPQAKLALREQRATIRSMLEEKADFTPEMLASMSDKELSNYLELYGSEIVLANTGKLAGQSLLETGQILRKSLQQYKKAGKAATDNLYTQAEQFGRVEIWNLREAQEFAARNSVPIEGRAARVPDENGNLPMGEGVNESITVSAKLNQELKNIYDTIRGMDPAVTLHKDNSGLKQLMTLRTRVADLMLQDLPSEQGRKVNELYDVLTRTIENPVTGNEAFAAKWREANDTYRAYMDFLRFGEVKAALGSKPAERVAEKFMQPKNFEFLQLVKRNLTADPNTAASWDALKQGFKDQYTTSTAKLATAGKALDKFGQEELNLLLSKEEQRNLRTASYQAQQILNGQTAKMLREFNTDGARILQFAQEGNEAEIKRLVETAGGADSNTAAALRAGVFQNLLAKSTYLDQNTGKEVVNPTALSKALGELKASRRVNTLFRPEDWRRFNNWEKVAAVIGSGSDEGSSIQVGEVASELIEAPMSIVTNPVKTAKLVLKLGFSDTLGYVLSRPASFEKVLQASEAMDAKRRDRAAINATWQVMADLTQTYSQREDLTPMQENERAVELLKENPGVWEYIKGLVGADTETEAAPEAVPVLPAPAPAPRPSPAPGQQGSLQRPPAPANMNTSIQNMARAMPPQMPQGPAPAQQQGIAGSRYAALFPGDTLGAMAASGGIGSLRG